MEMFDRVATPATAATGFVPDSTPPDGFVPIASVIDAVDPVTVLLFASCTVTWIAGAMPAPAAALLGCTVKASLVAAPGVMLNAALVAFVRPAELATKV